MKQRLFVVVREAGSVEAGHHHLVDHEVDQVLHPPWDLDLVVDGEEVGLDDDVLKDHFSHILHCKIILPHLVSCRDQCKAVIVINFAREEPNVVD